MICIPIHTRECTKRVSLQDVLKIEKRNRVVTLNTTDEDFRIYDKLDNLIPYLDENFVPCLKNCYINLKHVQSMEDQSIIFDNGMIYYLGRNNYIRTRQLFARYLLEEKQRFLQLHTNYGSMVAEKNMLYDREIIYFDFSQKSTKQNNGIKKETIH